MSLPDSLETVKFSGFDCPKCSERLFVESSGPATCPDCGWSGEAYLLKALKERVEPAPDALPEKAVCAHHPTKQAWAVCAGTGDYICSLCAVEVGGRIYGAGYLDRAGRETLEKTYSRHLARPDATVVYLLLASFLIFFLAPALLPFAAVRYYQAVKLRGSDPIYRRVFTVPDMIIKGLLLLALILFTALIIIGIVFGGSP
jgi:hypothetical protein